MADCAACGRQLASPDSTPTVRGDGNAYHLGCAPAALLEQVSEEYRAILRKGIRYFVEKYGDPATAAGALGSTFLALGQAVEDERARRTHT